MRRLRSNPGTALARTETDKGSWFRNSMGIESGIDSEPAQPSSRWMSIHQSVTRIYIGLMVSTPQCVRVSPDSLISQKQFCVFKDALCLLPPEKNLQDRRRPAGPWRSVGRPAPNLCVKASRGQKYVDRHKCPCNDQPDNQAGTTGTFTSFCKLNTEVTSITARPQGLSIFWGELNFEHRSTTHDKIRSE
jgi:hypothetical protein